MSKLVVISGPSGVGKGTVVELLKEKYKENNRKLYLSISCTTRLPREGEINNVHYIFITEEEFKKRIEEGDFLEYNQYGTGKFYGTPKKRVLDYLSDGYDVILEIDINGYKQIKENYPDAVGIFIMPPSVDELLNRLKTRGTETDDVIKTRILTAKNEIENNSIYDYIIVNYNGEQEKTATDIYNYIRK